MFTVICDEQAIDDDQSKGFNINEHDFFVIKKDGVLYAYKNQCPHLGIPLEMTPDQFLDCENALIQCSTHGALFLIDDGLCVSGPCNGQSLLSIPIRVEDQKVLVDLSVLNA